MRSLVDDPLSAASREDAHFIGPVSTLCAPFVSALPIDSAAILTLVSPFDAVLFCSSSSLAAELADAEIDLGDGPGWEALRKHTTVCEPRLEDDSSDSWPAYRSAVKQSEVTGLYAVPLSIGTLDIGAIDLYLQHDQQLTKTHLHHAEIMAGLAALQVFRHAMEHRNDDDHDEALSSRREVHQATGVVIAQLSVSPTDALLLIRARAFAAEQPVRAIAADIVTKRIKMSL